jgi:hypothetical protein
MPPVPDDVPDEHARAMTDKKTVETPADRYGMRMFTRQAVSSPVQIGSRSLMDFGARVDATAVVTLEYNLWMACQVIAQAEVDPRSIVDALTAAKQRLQPQFPDMDPCDLDLILTSLLRPFGSGRRFFLREVRPGVRVF